MTGSSDLLLCETVLDDISPEYFELLAERLREAGATSVEFVPAFNAAGRPGYLARAICPVECREQVSEAFILHSTAQAVRIVPCQEIRAGLEIRSVTTRWGEARLHLKLWQGIVIDARPLYEDAAALARESEAPLSVVTGEITRLGEAYVGRRLANDV